MKLFTCLATTDLKKLPHLSRVLMAQKELCDEVHVNIITNKIDPLELKMIMDHTPEQSQRFKIEVINRNYEDLPSPWLLTWMHKTLMLEKYQDSSYTHFMCIEDDMEVSKYNFQYWIKYREVLKPFHIYPSFLRVEFNNDIRKWVALDLVEGDSFEFNNLPKFVIDNFFSFINIGRTYQGMFLYDRELMKEYINSGKYSLEECVPDWPQRIQHIEWPLGLTEAAVNGLSGINVPSGCYSRNFLPFSSKFNLLDPSCFVHHLPNKYTSDPTSDHGKVLINEIFK